MTETLLYIVLALQAALLVVGVILLTRKPAQSTDHTQDLTALKSRLENVFEAHDRLEREITDEIKSARADSTQSASNLRNELGNRLDANSTAISQTLTSASGQQHLQVTTALAGVNTAVSERLGDFSKSLTTLSESGTAHSTALRTELDQKLGRHEEKLTQINKSITDHLDKLRTRVEERLTFIQQSNDQKLEQMRATVDEKLQGTLDKRLGDSFKQVSERLEQVYTGLGEVRALSSGVNDLKRVMTNVKSRGTWGEWQLATLLQEMLTPAQFAANVQCRAGSQSSVEFAVRLPGRAAEGDPDACVWLPIDSKFPVEDYQRLLEASERVDVNAVTEATKALINRVYACAKDIREKYINPPLTTDFAILFLPTESLFAEVLRHPGVVDELQRTYRVNVAGPTTLASQLNSLQMGFRTLAIEKRSSEVWEVLGAVKTEFGKFATTLSKVEKKLQEASNTVQEAATRTRAIERRMRSVEALPDAKASALLDTALNGEAEPTLLPAPNDD